MMAPGCASDLNVLLLNNNTNYRRLQLYENDPL